MAEVPRFIPTPLRAATFQTMIGLLAVTGMRVGEVIALERRDIDWADGVAVIRNTKFNKSREVPLDATTVDALASYARVRDRYVLQPKSPTLFVSTKGTPVIYTDFGTDSRKLVVATRVGAGTAVIPRVHDFRRSFAIHTLIRWYHNGDDVGALLPRLSTYLGHLTPTKDRKPSLLDIGWAPGGRLQRSHLAGRRVTGGTLIAVVGHHDRLTGPNQVRGAGNRRPEHRRRSGMSRLRRPLGVLFAVVGVTACGGHPVAVKPGPVPGVTEARAIAARTSASVDDAKRGAASVDQFGLDILRQNLGLARGNVALSPTSIATALSMARAGAAGSTAAEMDKVLHLSDQASANQAMNSLTQQLASRNGTFPLGSDDPLAVELNAANACFAQQETHFEQPFLDEMARSYGAGVQLVDYQAQESARRAINSWVGGQTHARIPELLAPRTPPLDSRLVLVNAVYLKADWMVPFQKAQTIQAQFGTPAGSVNVPFMHGDHVQRYLAGDRWQAVELPYAGGKLAMTVLVPDQGQYDAVAAQLTPGLLDRVDQAPPVGVDLQLPKFDINYHLSLKGPLSELGMPTAFTDNANFSAMTSQEALKIADVVHQATVTVDEKGTVAAAATAIIMVPTAAPASNVTLVVDRPFMFFIRDLPTGAIVFAGQVSNPGTKN